MRSVSRAFPAFRCCASFNAVRGEARQYERHNVAAAWAGVVQLGGQAADGVVAGIGVVVVEGGEDESVGEGVTGSGAMDAGHVIRPSIDDCCGLLRTAARSAAAVRA